MRPYPPPQPRSSSRSTFVRRGLFAAAPAASTVASSAKAQTFTWTGNTNSNWKNAGNWSPAGGPPNATDAVAIWNVGSTGISTKVNLPVTVGSIVINQPDSGTANVTISNSANDILTFATSTGDATFINQLATGTVNDGTSNVTVSAAIQLNSPLDVTSAFDAASNTAITFSGGITGSQTITLGGGGNLQLTTVGTAFTGQIVVNDGIMPLPDDGLTSAGNVTVNSGGQFQIGSTTVTNWSLGTARRCSSMAMERPRGSITRAQFRFQTNSAAASFDTPIVLQSNASIYVNGNLAGAPPTVGTLTISQAITGAGVLTKNGTGVLVLANDNAYSTATPTTVAGGTLVLADAVGDGGFAVPGDVTVGTLRTPTRPSCNWATAVSNCRPPPT